MTASQTSPADGEQQLFEQLAILLETRERTGSIDTGTCSLHDPDLAAGVEDYFAAADVVTKFAAGLAPQLPRVPLLRMPERLGDFELISEIGRGGAAVVYRARQIGLNRLVAIKMLQGGRPGSLHDVDRLRFEAEAVAQLQHPGIVPIHDVGEHDGRPYFCMPLFEAGSLSGRLQDFASQPRRAAELVEAIADAVQHAHERGILHRDLKPSNILLDAYGRPHVADFGLAKRLAGDQELTKPGELIGTPAYMAPERVAGSAWAGPATIATDVYGLGAILYVLLTGHPPFTRETPIETLLEVGTADVVAPRAHNPAIDRDLELICLRCLEKNPAARYATAAAVADDLRRWRHGEPIAARPIRGVERARRWCRRHPVRATAVLAAGLLILLGGIGLTTGYLVVSDAYQEAQVHRQTAESHAARLNRQLYVSQMSLAHRHLQRGELVELRSLLNQFQEQSELLGFEWRWFDRQARMMPREVARFAQHTHILYGGDLSPDGRTAATCGADGTIRLWDAVTGIEQRVLENGAGLSSAGVPFDENTVAFSPDGTMLATAGEDGGIRLWNLPDGTRAALTPTWPAEARCVFSPDGRLLAGCWTDGHLQVWDVATRSLRWGVAASQHAVHAACFTPSGAELITADMHEAIAVWDSDSGNQRLRFESPVSLRAVAVAPNGDYVAVAGMDEQVRLHRLSDGLHELSYAGGSGIRSLAYSPDGTLLVAAGNDGCVRMWDTASHCRTRTFKAHSSVVWSIAFSPDGSRLLTAGGDRTAVVWNVVDTGVRAEEWRRLEPLRSLTCSPDGRQLATGSDQGIVRVHDAASFDELSSPPAPASRDSCPVFLRDGRWLAFVDQDRAIRLWDMAAGRYALPDPFHTEPAVDRNRRGPARLAVLVGDRLIAKSSTGPLFLCDGDAWNTLSIPDEGDPVHLLGVLADHKTLALRRENPAQIELWAVGESRVELLSVLPVRARVCAASVDGHWLALGDDDGTIALIDPAVDSRQTLIGHYAGITSLDFSPDGRTLVSTSLDGTARLWNIATGAELFTIVDGEQPLYSARFFPDGRTLAVGGDPEANRASLLIYRTE